MSSRLNPVSKKRRKLNRERKTMVDLLLGLRPFCEARLFGCQVRTEHIHEPLTRARGGSIVDPENAMALCANCHRILHDHPALACEIGLMRHSWEKA